MRYDDKKPKIIRRVMFALIIIITVLLQNNAFKILLSFKVSALPVLPLVICISMFERETVASLFGVLAGVIADISSGVDGFNAFVLVVICACASLLISHFMRNNIVTAIVLSAAGTFIYQLIYIIVFIFAAGGGVSINAFVFYYLPSYAVTLLFIPVFYFLIKTIFEHFKTEA